MNGYIFFYEGKRIEVRADTLYAAKLKALAELRVPRSKEHRCHGMIAEREDGTPVVHVADF